MSTTSDARPILRLGILLDHRVIRWSVCTTWLTVLAWQGALSTARISEDATSLLPWVVCLIIVHLLPITGWRSAQMVVDWPIQAAAALVLSPIETAIVAFVSSIDPRELTRRVSFGKALFNRSQIALITYAGALAVHGLSATPSALFQVLPLAFTYLAVTVVLNFLLVGVVMSREQEVPLSEALNRLRPGMLPDFALSFVTWGVLGAMIAILFQHVGWPALLAVLGPTLLGRQVITRGQMAIEATKAYESRDGAIAKLETQIYEERSDERRIIAADLHDEVLQPLFKVTLMAHVLKADLSTGRLLEIDADLPELLSAAETASNTLRELIGDLRRSSLGVGGLPVALSHLIENLGHQIPIEISADIQPVQPDSVRQLVLYQVAKEALGNATAHAQASRIAVRLSEDSGHWVLEVTDDGIGFDPSSETFGHFGIPIMKERTTAMGGSFFLDSAPRMGCRVRAVLPKPELPGMG